VTGWDIPNPDHVALYARLYPVYQSLYPALKPSFDQEAAF